MRTAIFISIFICLFLHFRGRKAPVQMDELNIQSSSITFVKPAPVKAMPLREVQSQVPAEVAIVETEEPANEEDYISDEDIAQVVPEDEINSLPWDDIDEGWKSQLKEYLVSIDPEKGEEMFAAYLEEKKKFVERVDFGETENPAVEDSVASDLADSDASVEYDSKEGEIERIHQQNLKDIFGEHMSAVEALHKEYVESIQYLNRTSAKFNVTL